MNFLQLRRRAQVGGIERMETQHAPTRECVPVLRGLDERSLQVVALALSPAARIPEETAAEAVAMCSMVVTLLAMA